MAIIIKCDPSNVEADDTFTSKPVWIYENCELILGEEVFVWWTETAGRDDGLAMRGNLVEIARNPALRGRRTASLTVKIDAKIPNQKLTKEELAKYDERRSGVPKRPDDHMHKLCRKLLANSHQKVASLDSDEATYLRGFFGPSARGDGTLEMEQQKNLPEPAGYPLIERMTIGEITDIAAGTIFATITGLEQWIETLPFPLASILRAWQATPSQDFKTKHEHLLHFFEGTAEFLSVIFLSAYRSNEALFETHQQKLLESMQKQKLSFEQATFGTWKFILEYLGSQTRRLLSGNKDARTLCGDIFSDQTLTLPEALSRKELAAIISTTNKMRNDWTGHGGVVGQEEARGRNEQLLGELQKLRDVMADAWAETQLIYALHTRARAGVFENEVAILMGSNSEFLKETRPMSIWLDVERLYLSNKVFRGALKLIPLVQVGPSPESAKNACYFFSRLERDGARFVSYHYTDRPELKGRFDEATEAIKFLTEF